MKHKKVSAALGMVGLLCLTSSTAAAGPSGQLAPPYNGSTWGMGGCAHYEGATFGEICNGFDYADLSTGQVGGFTRIWSGDFGRRPLVRGNRAVGDGFLYIEGTLRKASPSLPVTINLHVDNAEAFFDGTRGLSSSPIRLFAHAFADFVSVPCGCAYAYTDARIVDNDDSTAAPASLSGDVVLTMNVLNVPKGDFLIEVRGYQYSELFQGDTGLVIATMDARVTSIRVG